MPHGKTFFASKIRLRVSEVRAPRLETLVQGFHRGVRLYGLASFLFLGCSHSLRCRAWRTRSVRVRMMSVVDLLEAIATAVIRPFDKNRTDG